MQVLELPYAGDDLSLVVLLPTRQDGIESLGKQLSADRLAELLARLQPQLVDVHLPKFRLESQFQLSQALAALGMSDAFSSSADFSGISRDADLQLSDVIHKTEIELNEEGTEADAASGAVATVKSMKSRSRFAFWPIIRLCFWCGTESARRCCSWGESSIPSREPKGTDTDRKPRTGRISPPLQR